MGAKVLNSDNEDVKQRVLSGETSISAGYKKLIIQNVEICRRKKDFFCIIFLDEVVKCKIR